MAPSERLSLLLQPISPARRARRKTDAELLAVIENGRPPTAMVGWKGQLSAAEIQDVLAYVKSLRQ